jgi:hypothetical protein
MAITTNGAAGSALTISADLAATISDESGTGAVVFNVAPTLTNTILSGTLSAGGSVGTAGQVLTSTGSGVAYATASAGTTANDQAFAFAVQVFA